MVRVSGNPGAAIPEEIIQILRSRLGSQYRLTDTFNESVSKEAIRKFADGIGDSNPLWQDAEYAQKTRYGCLIAPPSWLYSVFIGWDMLDVPAGIFLIPAGHDWEYFRPVMVGDRITVDCKYTDLEIKRSGSTIIEGREILYKNQHDALVAMAKSWRISVKSLSAEIARSYKPQGPAAWTDGELAQIENEALGEQVRGNLCRYWEDVNEGEELAPVVKGPFGLADMVAYLIGASPVRITAHGSTLRFLRSHPRLAIRDPETGSPERRDTSHFNASVARLIGGRSGFCYGGQNHCWVVHLLTNWMGDEGWLKKSSVRYRGIINFSDVVRCKGRVARKYIDERGEHCADIETGMINQKGDNVVDGNATLVLSSREKGTRPLEKRLSSGA